MPFANNQRVRIYYEVEGQGPPLVLQHGFAGSLEWWREFGFTAAFRDDYRLILIDARGHGHSDKPHEPEAYRPPLRAADVLAVLDELEIEQTHYLGYSMGAVIGLAIAGSSPGRLASLILGGASPYQPSTPEALAWMAGLRGATREGLESLVAFFESTGDRLPPAERARMLANDREALLAPGDAGPRRPGGGGPVDSSAQRAATDVLLRRVNVPCLLYGGREDPLFDGAEEASARLPRGRFVAFEGLEHFGAYRRSDLVVPVVKQFLSEVGER